MAVASQMRSFWNQRGQVDASARTPALSPVPAPALSRRQRVALVALLVVGTGVRVWISLTNYGVVYDTDTASIVAHLLATHPLHAYSSVRYPYPAGYLPVLLGSHAVSTLTGVPFWKLWKLPATIGDAGLALALVWGLGRRGCSASLRLGAAAAVALGPIFVIVSGYHGQLDPVAILPALVAVVLWEAGGARRAWSAGILIGLGAAIKTVPFFVVLALLPTARSRREAAIAVGCAVAVPLLTLLPFLIDNFGPTWKSLTFNHGVGGLGGLSVLVQPSLVHGWLVGPLPHLSSATLFFTAKQNLMVGVAVLLAAGVACRRRLDAVDGAVLIWLGVYIANFNWAYQYFVWGLPFFLLAGWLRQAVLLQLLLIVPAVEMYLDFDVSALGWAVIPLSLATWALLVVAAGMVLRRSAGRTRLL